MKKFQLTITMAGIVTYQSVLSFTKEQQNAYLKRVVAHYSFFNPNDFDANIFQYARDILKLDTEKWPPMDLGECAIQYPDIVTCVAIEEEPKISGIFDYLNNFNLKLGDSVEEKIISNKLRSYNWRCLKLDSK